LRGCGAVEVERARFGRAWGLVARGGRGGRELARSVERLRRRRSRRVASACGVAATRVVATFTTTARAFVEPAFAIGTCGSAGTVAFATLTAAATTAATATRTAPGTLAAIALWTLLLAVAQRRCG
jgi:hypothetical protein